MAAITDDDVANFNADGFVLIRGFLTPDEAAVLSAVTRADPCGRGHPNFIRRDASDGATERATELLGLPKGDPERPKTTMYDAVCYSERMISAMGRLLPGARGSEGGAVTLHHRKVIMKDQASAAAGGNSPAGRDSPAGEAHSRGGGYGGGNRFAWHQDFSYWCEGNPYQRAPMLSPDVATCAIAIDRAAKVSKKNEFCI